MRKVSKKIMFVDLVSEGSRLTAVFKFWETPELLNRATRGPDKIHVGDTVSCAGDWNDGVFVVNNYRFTTKWSDVSAGKPFLPQPPQESSAARPEQKPCKYYVNSGRCQARNCNYRHHTDDTIKTARREFVQAKLERRILVHEEKFAEGDQWRSASKRAELFSSWIATRYGWDFLQGGVVLDVAGGRGDLAFELAVKQDFTCQVDRISKPCI